MAIHGINNHHALQKTPFIFCFGRFTTFRELSSILFVVSFAQILIVFEALCSLFSKLLLSPLDMNLLCWPSNGDLGRVMGICKSPISNNHNY